MQNATVPIRQDFTHPGVSDYARHKANETPVLQQLK